MHVEWDWWGLWVEVSFLLVLPQLQGFSMLCGSIVLSPEDPR